MILDFTITESSDNSSVTIQDTTADWDVGQIQDVFDSGTATITVTILGTAYDAIDVKSYFDGGLQSGLTFVINPEDLEIGGVAQFAATENIPDGDWSIVYAVDDGDGETDTETQMHLVYGTIEKEVTQMIRITEVKPLTFEETLRKAMIRLAHWAYLKGIINSAYVSEVSNLRTALSDLETMIENGAY